MLKTHHETKVATENQLPKIVEKTEEEDVTTTRLYKTPQMEMAGTYIKETKRSRN